MQSFFFSYIINAIVKDHSYAFEYFIEKAQYK